MAVEIRVDIRREDVATAIEVAAEYNEGLNFLIKAEIEMLPIGIEGLKPDLPVAVFVLRDSSKFSFLGWLDIADAIERMQGVDQG